MKKDPKPLCRNGLGSCYICAVEGSTSDVILLDFLSRLIGLFQCGVPGDLTHTVHAACEHRACQRGMQSTQPCTAFSVPSKFSGASSTAVASR